MQQKLDAKSRLEGAMFLRTVLTTLVVAGALLVSVQAQAQSYCPNGGHWCGAGRGCCAAGLLCAPNGGCMKKGYHDCGPGRGLCGPGWRCAPVKGCER
jgi:hypothetical protein